MTKRDHSKKRFVQCVKIALSVGILAYLVWDSMRRGEGLFSDEHGFHPEKLWALLSYTAGNWSILLLALIVIFLSVMISFIRWWLLIRAIGVPIALRESLKFSFVGSLLNLAPMGMVGGDLAKVVLVARHCPDHRAQSVASVFVDRVVGLYGLFLVASGAILITGFYHTGPTVLQSACRLTLLIALIGTGLLLAAWAPDWSNGKLLLLLERLPVIGRPIARFAVSFRGYGKKPCVLAVSLLVTLPVHLLFAIALFLMGTAMFPKVHDLGRHFVFVPLASVMQILPVSIGPAEFVLDRLFVITPMIGGGGIPAGQGMITLLVHRLFSAIISLAGVAYFLTSRQEWTEVLHEVEESPEALELDQDTVAR